MVFKCLNDLVPAHIKKIPLKLTVIVIVIVEIIA